MRFYRIEITNEKGVALLPSSLRGGAGDQKAITSLLPNGNTNPAALNVEIDLAQYVGHEGADVRSYVRIWGLSLKDISRAFDLNPNSAGGDAKRIKIMGGMAKGYPLADPSQQGLLVKGRIQQAFGNWLGTEMTLDMFLAASGDDPQGEPAQPENFTFTWRKGEKLSDLVKEVITKAMPDAKLDIDISEDRTNDRQDMPGAFQSLKQFAQTIHGLTYHAKGPDDQGVVLSPGNGETMKAFEVAAKPSTDAVKKLRFQDLLGQVTWYAPFMVTAKLVMRGDLQIGQVIQFPDGLPSTATAAAMPAFGGAQRDRDKLSFSGAKFKIQQIQHWGNYRQADAMSWNTTIWAFMMPAA